MSESEERNADRAIKWLLDALAVAFIAESVASLMQEGFGTAVISLAIGLVLGATAFFWTSLKEKMPKKFSETIAGVACDFRYWLLILGIAFLYLGYPAVSTVRIQQSIARLPSSLPSAIDPATSLKPVTLSSEYLRGLTNEDLRSVAYTLAGQIHHFFDEQIHKQTDIENNTSYSEDRKSLEKLSLDSETNRIFRAKYMKSAMDSLQEFKVRIHDQNNVYLFQNLSHDMSTSGLIGLGAIDTMADELISLAKQLP